MDKIGAIYYSDNRPDPLIINVCQNQLRRAFDENKIVSVTLKPMNFGNNIVLPNRDRSYPTMITQILTALETSTADYVYFLEHDVLYHESHFTLSPVRDDIYYYNVNNWRWRWGTDIAITYDYLASLSMMCCNRELAIRHYKLRIEKMIEQKLDEHRSREPRWARRWGYEPGTKLKRKGGFTDEGYEIWRSEYPNIDIRHSKTFSKPKTTLEEFKHKPLDSWVEGNVYNISGWNLKGLFSS